MVVAPMSAITGAYSEHESERKFVCHKDSPSFAILDFEKTRATLIGESPHRECSMPFLLMQQLRRVDQRSQLPAQLPQLPLPQSSCLRAAASA